MRMVEMNIFLYDCCQYPTIQRQSEVFDKCLKTCSSFDYCCFQECSARESETFNEEKNSLDAKKLKSLFAIQNENGKFENMTEEWVRVVSDAVDNCNGKKF